MDVGSRIVVLTIGGACGVNARYWLGLLVDRWVGARFPWATILINVSGSFAIGLGAVVLAERWPDPLIRIFTLTGFLGGYTTFSAYMLESFTLWERGDRTQSMANLVGSLVAGVVAVSLGVTVGRWLVEPSELTPTRIARDHQKLESIGEAEAGREEHSESQAG